MIAKTTNLMPLKSFTAATVPGLKNEYPMDEQECYFVNSDEFNTLSPEVRDVWMNTPLDELVNKAREDEAIMGACLLFCDYVTGSIGVCEGEEFCNEYGFIDTAVAIAKTLGIDDKMVVDADWTLDITER